MATPTPEDRMETQRFAIFNELVNHCGQRLTAALLDTIMEALVVEMRTGPASWAFLPPKTD